MPPRKTIAIGWDERTQINWMARKQPFSGSKKILNTKTTTTQIRFPKGGVVAILLGSIVPASSGRPCDIPEGYEMKRPKLTTKQKRDRRLKIKRRRIRRQKYGL